MITCRICLDPITKQSKSGLCKPCSNRDPDVQSRRQIKRLETLAAQSPSERIARFQVRRGHDECWGWSGCHNGVGYPVMRLHKRSVVATHIALEMDFRPRPSPKHVACHSCDNPICTNPNHLWWGTEKENMQDASAKKRLKGNRFGRPRRKIDAGEAV